MSFFQDLQFSFCDEFIFRDSEEEGWDFPTSVESDFSWLLFKETYEWSQTS